VPTEWIRESNEGDRAGGDNFTFTRQGNLHEFSPEILFCLERKRTLPFPVGVKRITVGRSMSAYCLLEWAWPRWASVEIKFRSRT
jgi:hypothetical protein